MSDERRSNGEGRRSDDRRSDFIETLIAVLTSWRFWMVLWGFALVAVVAFVFVIYARESSDRAARHARAQATYTQCLAGIPATIKINRFLSGVRHVGGVLLVNAEAMHKITPPSTELYRTQAANLTRLRRALNDQRAVTRFPVATRADCLAELRRGEG